MITVALLQPYFFLSLFLFLFLIEGRGRDGLGLFTLSHCKYPKVTPNMIIIPHKNMRQYRCVYNMLNAFLKY